MKMYVKENIAQILLHEEVTQYTAEEMTKFIYDLEQYEEITDIIVSINSGGGSVVAGYSIFSALRNSTKTITTRIEGIAASIAGVIFLSGDKKEMLDYSLFMMHNPSGGEDNILLKIKDSLKEILGKHFTGDLDTMMNDETWLSAYELYSADIIDKVISSDVEITLEPMNTVQQLYDICNKLIKTNDTEMELEEEKLAIIENSEMETEITAETEIENEVEVEVEVETEVEEDSEKTVEDDELVEDVVETETETETEVEEIINESSIIEEMRLEIAKIKEEKEELQAQLDLMNNKKLEEQKLELLSKSNIEEAKYDEWMNLDVDTIKKLTNTIKVNASAPIVEIDNNNKELKFSNLTNEEKVNLSKTNIELYKKLYFENK